MIRAGVVGLGSMGRNHVRNYYEMNNVDLVAIADINEQTAKSVVSLYNEKDRYQPMVYTDYRELLNENLDIISIATPTITHSDIAVFFCDSGVNCLVEKPISHNTGEAWKIVDAAKKNNVKLAIGHIETFNPAVRKVEEILKSDLMGDILFMSTKRLGPAVPRITDVGIVIDSMSHDIGVVRYLAKKEPENIFSRLRSIKNNKGDCAFLLIDFPEFSASIEANWFTPYQVRTLEITGTKSILKMDYITQKVEIFNNEWHMISMEEKKEPLRIELEHFVDCVINNKTPLIDGDEGIKILEIAIAAEHNL